MRHLVVIPALLSVEVEANSVQQATDRADTEALRLLHLMGGLALDRSPAHCRAFDWQILGTRRIHFSEAASNRTFANSKGDQKRGN